MITLKHIWGPPESKGNFRVANPVSLSIKKMLNWLFIKETEILLKFKNPYSFKIFSGFI